ncbi:hypothetical protein RND81_14G237900 [Saponaria officinalis]|uniref:Uncharacterized protein n=1 Tax=Saponaria officinalis TaxID=3572 RepID=A0AAW1GSZ0_SAPOF
MAGRFGNVSRSLMSTTRSSSFLRSPPPSATHRLRSPPPFAARHRPSVAPLRSFAELGCVQSFLPFGNAAAMPCLTSHLSLDMRAFSELFNGTFCRTCQDR